MDDELYLEFLGIGFRSTSHMYWFQGSITFFGLSALLFAYLHTAKPPRETRRLGMIYLALVWLFHAFASVTASGLAYERLSHGQDPNGPLFSLDCIWFNGMIAGIYTVAIALTWLRFRKEANAPVPIPEIEPPPEPAEPVSDGRPGNVHDVGEPASVVQRGE